MYAILFGMVMMAHAASGIAFSPNIPDQHSREGASNGAHPAPTPRIYACVDERGNHLFTDHGCAALKRLPYEVTTPPVIDFSPLTADERMTLEEIADASVEAKRNHDRKRVARQRDAAAKKADQQAKCEQARSELRKLAHERRQGYSGREHAALERREGLYKRAKRANC